VTEVDFGWLFRSIHSWSANLLIGVLFLHLLTTFIMRAYRRLGDHLALRPRLAGCIHDLWLQRVPPTLEPISISATSVGTAIAGGVR